MRTTRNRPRAARQYPGESYLEQTPKLLQDRRALVQSFVAKAQPLEELDQFQDAAERLEGLRAVYPEYPNLGPEILRLNKRREEQLRNRALARFWTKVEAAEWAEAGAVLDQFATEFPDQGELASLRGAVQQGLVRERQASELAREGRDLCLAALAEPGLVRLREAFRSNVKSHNRRQVLDTMGGQRMRVLQLGSRPAGRQAIGSAAAGSHPPAQRHPRAGSVFRTARWGGRRSPAAPAASPFPPASASPRALARFRW